MWRVTGKYVDLTKHMEPSNHMNSVKYMGYVEKKHGDAHKRDSA